MTSDQAQREMEQRALRNVRGLVDKMEQSDQLEARKQRKVLLRVALAALALAVVAAVAISMRPQRGGTEVVVEPPAAKGGAPK